MTKAVLPDWDETNLCRRVYKRTIRRVGKAPMISSVFEIVLKKISLLDVTHAGNTKVLSECWPIDKRKRILATNVKNAEKGIIDFSLREIFYKGQSELQMGLKPEGKAIVSLASELVLSFYEDKSWPGHAVNVFFWLNTLDKNAAAIATIKLNSHITNS